MWSGVQSFFGCMNDEAMPADADGRYWQRLKQHGQFGADKAKLEALWSMQEKLNHMEIRSNVAGMGKDCCKERLEKVQWILYLNADFNLKQKYKVYVKVVQLWWDQKLAEAGAGEFGEQKVQDLLKNEHPIVQLVLEMWQLEYWLTRADVDRLNFEKLYDIAKDHLEGCSVWGQKEYMEEYLQALAKRSEVRFAVVAAVKQMELKLEELKADEEKLEKLQAAKAAVAAVYVKEGDKLLKASAEEIVPEAWMETSYRTRIGDLRWRVSADQALDFGEGALGGAKRLKVTADANEAATVIEAVVEEAYMQKPYMKLLMQEDAEKKIEAAWMQLKETLPMEAVAPMPTRVVPQVNTGGEGGGASGASRASVA